MERIVKPFGRMCSLTLMIAIAAVTAGCGTPTDKAINREVEMSYEELAAAQKPRNLQPRATTMGGENDEIGLFIVPGTEGAAVVKSKKGSVPDLYLDPKDLDMPAGWEGGYIDVDLSPTIEFEEIEEAFDESGKLYRGLVFSDMGDPFLICYLDGKEWKRGTPMHTEYLDYDLCKAIWEKAGVKIPTIKGNFYDGSTEAALFPFATPYRAASETRRMESRLPYGEDWYEENGATCYPSWQFRTSNGAPGVSNVISAHDPLLIDEGDLNGDGFNELGIMWRGKDSDFIFYEIIGAFPGNDTGEPLNRLFRPILIDPAWKCQPGDIVTLLPDGNIRITELDPAAGTRGPMTSHTITQSMLNVENCEGY